MFLLRLLSTMLVAVALLCAQSTTGDILGSVYDPSGAVITDAKVTVRNLDTNIAKEASTGDDGIFRFPLLPTGNYEVVVEKSGFTKYVQRPIILTLNRSADLRITMQVGATSETVSVMTDAPLI